MLDEENNNYETDESKSNLDLETKGSSKAKNGKGKKPSALPTDLSAGEINQLDPDALANQWEQELATDNANQTLAQDEIDDLFGDSQKNGGRVTRGIGAILKNNAIHYERLPMLEVIFDRMVRLFSTSMRNFTSENIDITIEELRSVRFKDYLNTIPLPAMLSVFKCVEWDNYGLIIVDSEMIYSIVDVLLGGRRGKPLPIEGRPYTTIERSIIERMVRLTLDDLEQAFQPVSQVNLEFERLEINPRFAMIARPNNAAIVIKFHLSMEERSGSLDLLLPYATIEPIRELLLQNFMGEKFGRDSIWEKHLAGQLWNTDFFLELRLPELTDNLKNVLQWEVGTQLKFNCSINDTMNITCENHPVIKGKMGQKNGLMAIRIEQPIQGYKGE
jgi:flagellar motor switch protein FliM